MRRGFLAVVGAMVVFGACQRDDRVAGPAARQPLFSHQFYDSVPGEGGVVCDAGFSGPTYEYTDGSPFSGPQCETSIGVTPSTLVTMRVQPGAYDPIHVAFSQPVSDLVVSSFNSVVHCGDPFGSVTAHRITGEEVTVDFQPYHPELVAECGSQFTNGDGVWFTNTTVGDLKATVPDGATVDRIVIAAPGGSRTWDNCWTDSTYSPPLIQCLTLQTDVSYIVLFREFATDLNAGIVVSCTGSGAPRGGTISCGAQPQNPADALQVTGWTFTSDAQDVVAREANVSDPTWAGQLVVNGGIVVTGTINGQPATGTASVTVTPRDWSAKTVRSNHSTPGADGLPIHPTALEAQLGLSDLDMKVRQDPANYLAFLTDGGPNTGFAYMTDIPFETFTVARVNYPVMTQGSDWYLLQYPRDKKVGGVTFCGQSRVLTLPPLVEAHEGTDPANQPNSHVGIYINDVTRDSRVQTEQLAGLASKLSLAPTKTAIHTAAVADSRAMDNDSRNNMNSSTLPCVFKYFQP